VIDEELLGRSRSEARREEIGAVERAILGAFVAAAGYWRC
jgi:hypothetical protein